MEPKFRRISMVYIMALVIRATSHARDVHILPIMLIMFKA